MKKMVALAIAAAAVPVVVAVAPVGADAARVAPGKPVSSITLTAADNGRHVRVHKGAQVLVRLAVDPRRDAEPSTWWRTVAASGHALQARPQTAIAIRGLTRGRYQAVARGESVLSSSRAVCPPVPSGPTCHSMQGWSVTVDVR